MHFIAVGVAFAIVLTASVLAAEAGAQTSPVGAASAERLFEVGRFAEAGALDLATASRNPGDYRAALQLGRVALLANQLEGARHWLERAIALRPSDSDAKVMLAETFYRRDDFKAAAAALAGVDMSNNALVQSQYPTLNVAKMASFKGQTPYSVDGRGTDHAT